MYGAIIGDLAGSIYEYNQTKKIESIDIPSIIQINSFYSDDTILTIAIIDAILNDKNYDKYLKKYIKAYENYKPEFTPYFKTPFSPSLIKWSKNNQIGISCGNGAMMRISPIGYLFNTEKEIIENSFLATIPSHNSEDAIEYSKEIALIIFYLRNGLSKEEVYKKLDIKLNYKPFKKFNYTCKDTIDNCLYALFYSSNFEDAIKKIIKMGGDTDTNACIVGSMAEALYGVPEYLKMAAEEKIPNEFVKILRRTNYINKISLDKEGN